MGLAQDDAVLALLLVMKTADASVLRGRGPPKQGGEAGKALRVKGDETRRASLLVAPASLLANWTAEIERFAPTLTAIIAHPSAMTSAELKALDRDRITGVDLVITSYGSLLRVPALLATPWRLAILDEAQAIKTPGAKQTRAAKQIDARARIALSGTPVENRLGDLWSIFDFLNPGLLGSGKAFSTFTKRPAATYRIRIRAARTGVSVHPAGRLERSTRPSCWIPPDKTVLKLAFLPTGRANKRRSTNRRSPTWRLNWSEPTG